MFNSGSSLVPVCEISPQPSQTFTAATVLYKRCCCWGWGRNSQSLTQEHPLYSCWGGKHQHLRSDIQIDSHWSQQQLGGGCDCKLHFVLERTVRGYNWKWEWSIKCCVMILSIPISIQVNYPAVFSDSPPHDWVPGWGSTGPCLEGLEIRFQFRRHKYWPSCRGQRC